jgi:hypothetical protein
MSTTPPPTPARPSFDQVVKGNIDIKQLSKNKYKITFSKVSKFLLYQVWSDSSKKLNEHRSVYYQDAKAWIKSINYLNASLKTNKKPLFTPTTVMEIGNHKYVFVIHKANINCKGHIFFKVSTEEIKLSSGNSKKILKLPCGHHDGVRFDIDENNIDATVCNPSFVYASCIDSANEDNENCQWVYRFCNTYNPYSYNFAGCYDGGAFPNAFSLSFCYENCSSNYPVTATDVDSGDTGYNPTPNSVGYKSCVNTCLSQYAYNYNNGGYAYPAIICNVNE